MSARACLLGCCLLLLHGASLRAQQGDALDDVLQHVPMATVVVLKACGAENHTTWGETLGACAATYLLGAGVAYGLKQSVGEWRPDDSDRRSFPSGHAVFAFAGATALRHEYGHLSPWVSVGGYGLAALVAADRVRRDRHYAHDVLAGAAIGTLSAELCYYLSGTFVRSKRLDVAFNGRLLSLNYHF